MLIRAGFLLLLATIMLTCLFLGCSDGTKGGKAKTARSIVTSDTILSAMAVSLLPPDRYSVAAILPPGQCPGHYDVKLSDIERMKKAALILSFKGMPFVDKARPDVGARLLVDAKGRNWMAPDSYIHGLAVLAEGLVDYFPEDKDEIIRRREEAIRTTRTEAAPLLEIIRRAGLFGKPLIASSMQKEPLLWLGFRVVGEYGRPEAVSTREIVRLTGIGRNQRVIGVVDNLQSGPDAGKGIAETLRVPHVVLTNFPTERGYIATLMENVEVLVTAMGRSSADARRTDGR